jgi:hypothetical protein
MYAVNTLAVSFFTGKFYFDIFARKDLFSFVDNNMRVCFFFLVAFIDIVAIRKE